MKKDIVLIEKLILKNDAAQYIASMCIGFFSEENNSIKIVESFHSEEKKYFDNLKFEKRVNSYLIGRYAAKKAVSYLIDKDGIETIVIRNGIFSQPIVENIFGQNIQVSITHCDNIAAAIAFPENLSIGIDVERIDFTRSNRLEKEFTKQEKDLISSSGYCYKTGLIILWTIKEALSKAIKTGLTVPLEILEISKIKQFSNYFLSNYKNFLQYQAISFIVNNYVYSITYPIDTELLIDIPLIIKKLSI